ncbi:MAG: hypothetical protein AVDCRST_MAG69-50, partial [uncultured Solirubrobacteraceae bacterium]
RAGAAAGGRDGRATGPLDGPVHPRLRGRGRGLHRALRARRRARRALPPDDREPAQPHLAVLGVGPASLPPVGADRGGRRGRRPRGARGLRAPTAHRGPGGRARCGRAPPRRGGGDALVLPLRRVVRALRAGGPVRRARNREGGRAGRRRSGPPVPGARALRL